jgi:hypothetical protein
MVTMIETYFIHSKNIAGVLFLFDIRMPNSAVDADSLEWLHQFELVDSNNAWRSLTKMPSSSLSCTISLNRETQDSSRLLSLGSKTVPAYEASTILLPRLSHAIARSESKVD